VAALEEKVKSKEKTQAKVARERARIAAKERETNVL